MNVDLAIVARDLKLPPENVEKTVQLLDEGNTIPFITRFRKDLTGGLNEKQILVIKQQVASLRALAERKSFILKSIESQGKLTDDLKSAILRATSSRRLEDVYLPFKPKKQTRAATAKQQGLEPLANDIFSADSPDVDLATRATEFVRVDKGLNSVDDVIRGVADLLVERFGENGDLRHSLRQVMWNTGKLVSKSTGVATESKNVEKSKSKEETATKKSNLQAKPETDLPKALVKKEDTTDPPPVASESKSESEAREASKDSAQSSPAESDSVAIAEDVDQSSTLPAETTTPTEQPDSAPVVDPAVDNTVDAVGEEAAPDSSAQQSSSTAAVTDQSETPATDSMTENGSTDETKSVAATAPAKKKKKKKKKKPAADPFSDYHDFQQSVKNIPHHRVLAINRGERAGQLKVEIKADDVKLTELARTTLVPEDHAFSEFLNSCAADALGKVLVPSLEREIRRELTEAAEKHAVDVFASNLRNLLLQAPIRDQRILAIDPGFKRGCSVAVLDPLGQVLDSGHVFVVGNATRRDESKQKLVSWIKQHSVDIVAIGNGAACRQTEQMVSDAIAEHLLDHKVRYIMVNEAGASIYCTSEIGREELPDATPSIRSAVSIGRRLQDPLSELVKISPANIGVGMYQHDVKAKHLSDSLDDVVEFCVNQVGVNVNTASPSLLKYVSGLNALAARRLVEHRQKINGFKNRNQLKEVNGIGDATFVQAAGFLRIRGGDEPLDSTSIHPESYELARNIINRVQAKPEKLFPYEPDVIPQPVIASPTPDTSSSSAEQKPADPPVSSEPADAPTVQESNLDAPAQAIAEPKVEAVEETNTSANLESSDAASTTQATPAEQPATDDQSATASASEETPQNQPVVPRSPNPRPQMCPERKEAIDKLMELDIAQVANENSAGKMLVRDVLLAIRKPDWDPRDKVKKPILRRGIIKVDDLKPEMQLEGQIVNVVDFGVFVDIGLGESSLVHVSQLSNQYVRDPYRFCAVGDVLRVWVSEVDAERRRVKLTAIRPGSKSSSSQSRSSGARKHAPSKKPYGKKPKGRSAGYQGSRKSTRTDYARRKPPKPVKPITDDMLAGDEPMRSFSDLLQFVNKKPEETKGSKKAKE